MKKFTFLIVIVSLSLFLSACGTKEEGAIDTGIPRVDKESNLEPILNDKKKTDKSEKIGESVQEITASTTDGWQTMERVREGISVKLPQGWYYVSNYKIAVENGFAMLIGFGDSSAVWQQEPPYEIEIISFKSDMEVDFDNYFKEAGEHRGYKFVIRAHEKYKDYIDLMADSLAFIDKE